MENRRKEQFMASFYQNHWCIRMDIMQTFGKLNFSIIIEFKMIAILLFREVELRINVNNRNKFFG